MSLWARFLAWIATAEKTPAGEAAAQSTIGADIAAAETVVNLAKDIIANKATITEALAAGQSFVKALAPFLPAPIVADVELALSVDQGLIALYQALPANWQFVKTDPGKPYLGDGINPEDGQPIGF